MNTLNSLYYFVESWIEISSQPSSSSISSLASATVAPHLEPSAYARRRRRLNRTHSLPYQSLVRPAGTAESSQEEYEESESESDQVMTSSNEGLARGLTVDCEPAVLTSSASEAASAEDDEKDDDGDDGTALGVLTSEPVFTPQPNIFSHPPQTQSRRHSEDPPTSYFQHRRKSSSAKPTASSYPNRKAHSHTLYKEMSPSHQAEQDAALRASLSTLLSCAAAARCLPKQDPEAGAAAAEEVQVTPPPPPPPPSDVKSKLAPTVEEKKLSRLLQHPVPRPPLRRVSSASLRSSFTSIHQQQPQKPKRKASASKDRHSSSFKRKRRSSSSSLDETLISPTLMTWVVSAGVVAILSAISFSAGYVMGKEVGRLETAGVGASPFTGATNSCGKEMGRGLKRLRWTASSNTLLKA